MLAHQTGDPFAATANALVSQFGLHPRTAIGPTTGVLDLLNPFRRAAVWCAAAKDVFILPFGLLAEDGAIPGARCVDVLSLHE